MIEQNSPKLIVSLLRMFAVLGVFTGGVVYGTVALASVDYLWFLSGFDRLPERVVIYHGGQQVELQPGDLGYSDLAEAIRASLDAGIARQSGIGMSDASLQDAFQKNVTVEAYFGAPIKLHAWFNIGEPTQILFPITGRHSELQVVFLGRAGRYDANPPALKDIGPIKEALKARGIPTDV